MTDQIMSFFDKEKQKIQDHIIIKIRNGYKAFGTYHLLSGEQFTTVDILKNGEKIGEFANFKNALAWCIADKFNQIELASSIQNLDHSFQRIDNELQITRKSIVINKKSRHVLISKFYTKVSVLENLKNQIRKYVEQAKYLQTRGFHHEIR